MRIKVKTDVKGSLSYAVHLLPPFSVMPHKGSMADGSVTVSRNVKRPHGMKKIRPASFRLRFSPPSGAKTAKIHFAVAGFAVLEVNGKALTDESGLDMLWSVYGKSVYSRTFEVPVKEGENIVTVRLGNGFWNIVPLRFWGQKHFREKLAH